MKKPTERCYCLQRCADGRWLLLNRDYKPFREGFTRNDWVDYDTCPGTRMEMTEAQLRQVEHGCTPYAPGDAKVWLYSDATRPDKSRGLLAAYMKRVAELGL